MIRQKPLTVFVSALVVPLALLGAACGSSGGGSSAAPSPTTASPTASPTTSKNATPATVAIAKTGLGSVLVDSRGRTLYQFGADSGTTSTCSGACAANWPPLVASGTPTVGGGAKASLVGTTTRSDGKTQVTYNGHPVYLFVGDSKAGDTNGQGLTAFGGTWSALTSAGNKASGSASSSGGGGSGY
jgi:predicted lipoprotein with Yx(FWY)xxD motif